MRFYRSLIAAWRFRFCDSRARERRGGTQGERERPGRLDLDWRPRIRPGRALTAVSFRLNGEPPFSQAEVRTFWPAWAMRTPAAVSVERYNRDATWDRQYSTAILPARQRLRRRNRGLRELPKRQQSRPPRKHGRHGGKLECFRSGV